MKRAATPVAAAAAELDQIATLAASDIEPQILERIRELIDVTSDRAEIDPTWCVIGMLGGTGAGKSSLVNALVGGEVVCAGVLRPTTNEACAVLPAGREPKELLGWLGVRTRVCAPGDLPGDTAIIDLPDIDSVEEGNRRLASELLDGADLWIFVTSAARYADAVAWRHLEEAAERGLRVAIVLNRVPEGAQEEIRADLASLARRRGLGEVPIIVIAEQPLTDGRLPFDAIAAVGSFLRGIGHDAQERAAIVRSSLSGAVAASLDEARKALDGARESYRAIASASEGIDQLVASGAREVASSSSDDVLRGEVSARIAEVLGSWDMTRTLARVLGSVRERVVGAVRGTAAPEEQVRRDLTGGLAQRLSDQYHRAWTEALRLAEPVAAIGEFEELLDAQASLERARRTAQAWTGEVTQIVRGQAESSRVTGRLLAGGINVVTVSLMVSAFAMTGGVTGVEVGVAGASAALSQTILESYFGERTVRALAAQAREALESLAAHSLADVVAPIAAKLDRSQERERIEALALALDEAREALA